MKNTTLRKLFYTHLLLSAVLLAGFSSCSSSKEASGTNDGIYGPSTQKEELVMVRDNQAGYYQNYFSQEKQEVDEIITDIESYQSYEEGADTVYVDSEYEQGKAPWGYSDTKVTVHIGMGFGGYWGWGYPGFGIGWGGYPGWGWGYPGWGWGGYPGWGWAGYPGWGWGYPGYGWGWGYYPPYNGRYTYGKRYSPYYGRFNTANIYNNTNTLSNRYYRSSDYNRRAQSRTYRSSSPGNAQYKGTYNRSSRNNNRNYQPNNRSYNKPNNRSYTPRNSSPSTRMRSSSPGMRSSSPGMSRGSSMGRSSGRRNLSYSNIRENQRYNRSAETLSNSSNRTFVKRTGSDKQVRSTRVSYTRPSKNSQYGNYSQVKRPVRVTKTDASGKSYRSSSGNRSSYQRSSSGKSTISRSSSGRSGSSSSARSSSFKPSNSSSGASRSSRGGTSSPRSKQ